MIRTVVALMALLVAQTLSAQGMSKKDFALSDTVNPCQDFYQYACGPTIEAFELPETRSVHIFSFDDISERLLASKKNYFDSLLLKSPSTSRERQLQTYYNACMNADANKHAEKELVFTTLQTLADIQTRQQFVDFLYNNLKAGKPSFLSFSANVASFTNSENMDGYFTIDLVSLAEKSYYEDQKLTQDLNLLMVKFFESIGYPDPVVSASWVLEFEKSLAAVSPSGTEFNKNIFSLTEFSKDLSSKLVNLKTQDLIASLPGRPHIRNLYGDQPFELVEYALTNYSLPQLKAIYAYHSLKTYLDDAYPEFKQADILFHAQHFGRAAIRPDRQERCVTEVSDRFGMEIDSILFPKLFPNFPKQKVRDLTEKVRNGLLRSIEQNTWLSAEVRNAALLKLKNLNIRLVAPETEQEWNFNKEGQYSDASLTHNRLLYRRLQFEKQMDDLTKKFTQPVWGFGPLNVNAALLPPYNAIIFPVAILQPPFFDPEASEEINLGGIGAVIGHELGHAIDDKGYTFDHKGKLNPWIKDDDEKKFFDRAQPLIDQFDSVDQDGQFTLGENIGDLVGLTNAYKIAFPAGVKKPVSLKKDFFIQYARLWCEVQKPAFGELRKKTDTHAFGFARTNEQVKHQPGFAEAFSCKANDQMVLPKDKIVRIW